MTCYHPLTAYWDLTQPYTSNGCRRVTFDASKSIELYKFQLPCGRCIGCRLDRSLEWAVRCVHESQLHEQNCFITLTYDDVHLPSNGGLQSRDLTLFWKRLRKRFDCKLSYFASGEYGAKSLRPHYHAILFGFDFPDKVFFKRSKTGHSTYVSESLSELWPLGMHAINSVSFESCAYVARYITKKQLGDGFKEYFDKDTGESFEKEFTRCSLKPAIGLRWIEQYWQDVYKADFDKCVVKTTNGVKKFKVPEYYDRWLFDNHPDVYEKIKLKRFKSSLAIKRNADFSPDRLAVKEKIKQNIASKLIRPFECEVS